MDSIATTAASAASTLASSQVTETYNWGGRQRAQFDADMDAAAKATGSDKIQLGFKDFLDMVNPLQHIPVVSDIYQAITGDDDIKPAMKTTGDIMYGGPIAGLGSVFNNILKQATGNDMSTTVANWLGLGSDAPVQTASAAGAAASAQTAATAPQPKVINLAASPSGPDAAAATAQTAAANPAAPDSPLFDHLKKGAAPQGKVLGAGGQQKFFNPTAKQYSGVKPASFGASASPNAISTAAAAAPTQDAAIASNAAIAGTGANDAAPTPQSEFAQKMLAAMDRYEAAKKTGSAADAPAVVSTGL